MKEFMSIVLNMIMMWADVNVDDDTDIEASGNNKISGVHAYELVQKKD